MSVSNKLIRGDNDLALTETELVLKGTRDSLVNTSTSSRASRVTGQTVENMISTELLHRSRRIVDGMNARGLPKPRIIRSAFEVADLLGGEGFQTGRGVVEITGEASSGKTQLLLDIALSCPKKAAYIVTEGRFPGDRLSQLTSYKNRWPSASMDRILISRVTDLEELMHTINKDLPRLLATQAVDAVIVDSITWPFRVEDGCKERTKTIQDTVRTLHRLSKQHNVLVVCANHVAADLTAGGLRPCLGASWSKGISGRLVLSIKDREKGVRNLRVDWCENYLPWRVGENRDFHIRPEGLVLLNGNSP